MCFYPVKDVFIGFFLVDFIQYFVPCALDKLDCQIIYSCLVKEGIIGLDKVVELMSVNPRKRFGLEPADETKDFAVWELEEEYAIDPEKFLTKGRATPFDDWKVQGRCVLNVVNDKVVWKDEIL